MLDGSLRIVNNGFDLVVLGLVTGVNDLGIGQSAAALIVGEVDLGAGSQMLGEAAGIVSTGHVEQTEQVVTLEHGVDNVQDGDLVAGPGEDAHLVGLESAVDVLGVVAQLDGLEGAVSLGLDFEDNGVGGDVGVDEGLRSRAVIIPVDLSVQGLRESEEAAIVHRGAEGLSSGIQQDVADVTADDVTQTFLDDHVVLGEEVVGQSAQDVFAGSGVAAANVHVVIQLQRAGLVAVGTEEVDGGGKVIVGLGIDVLEGHVGDDAVAGDVGLSLEDEGGDILLGVGSGEQAGAVEAFLSQLGIQIIVVHGFIEAVFIAVVVGHGMGPDVVAVPVIGAGDVDLGLAVDQLVEAGLDGGVDDVQLDVLAGQVVGLVSQEAGEVDHVVQLQAGSVLQLAVLQEDVLFVVGLAVVQSAEQADGFAHAAVVNEDLVGINIADDAGVGFTEPVVIVSVVVAVQVGAEEALQIQAVNVGVVDLGVGTLGGEADGNLIVHVVDVGQQVSEHGFSTGEQALVDLVQLDVVDVDLDGHGSQAVAHVPQFAVQGVVVQVVVRSDGQQSADVLILEDQFALLEVFVAPAGGFDHLQLVLVAAVVLAPLLDDSGQTGQRQAGRTLVNQFAAVPALEEVRNLDGVEDVPQQGGLGGDLRIDGNGDLALGIAGVGIDGDDDLAGHVHVSAQEELVQVAFVGLQVIVSITVGIGVANAVDDGLITNVTDTVQIQSVVDDSGHLGTRGGAAVDDFHVVKEGLVIPLGNDLLRLGDVVGGPGAGQLVGVTNGTQHHGGDFLLGHGGVRGELAAADTDHQTVVVAAVDEAFSPMAFINVGEGGLLSSVEADVILLAEHIDRDLREFGTGQVVSGTVGATPTGVAFQDAESSQTIDIAGVLSRRFDVGIIRDSLVGSHGSGAHAQDHSQRQKND